MRESKECAQCEGLFFRPDYANDRQWDGRKYCSVACANQGLLKAKAARKEELAREGAKVTETESEAESEQALPPQKLPVMRELRIVRVGPNPKLVVCEYFELAQRRVCRVNVKRTEKYVRGMRFKMAEPASEADFVRPWIYRGAAPRHRGRW